MYDTEQPATQDSNVADNQSVAEEPITTSTTEAENDQASPDAASTEVVAEDELGELDVDGEKFALPKKVAERLQSERMMNADYTRKTQALAEDRRQLESHEQALAKQYEAQKQFLEDHAKVHAIQDQLAEYEKVNWPELIQNDPIKAMELQHYRDQLNAKLNAAQGSIAQKQQQLALDEQQSFAKQVQEAKAYVEREIPGWNEQRDNQLHAYVQSIGLNGAEISRFMVKNPALFSVMHKAELYDQLVKKQPAKQTQQTPQAKPVPKVGGNKGVDKDPSMMTDREYAAWRKSQIRNRN